MTRRLACDAAQQRTRVRVLANLLLVVLDLPVQHHEGMRVGIELGLGLSVEVSTYAHDMMCAHACCVHAKDALALRSGREGERDFRVEVLEPCQIRSWPAP